MNGSRSLTFALWAGWTIAVLAIVLLAFSNADTLRWVWWQNRTRIEHSTLSDTELRTRSVAVAKELLALARQTHRPDIDGDFWAEIQRPDEGRLLVLEKYVDTLESRVRDLLAEFARHGVIDRHLLDQVAHPSDPYDIEDIARGLARLASQLPGEPNE